MFKSLTYQLSLSQLAIAGSMQGQAQHTQPCGSCCPLSGRSQGQGCRSRPERRLAACVGRKTRGSKATSPCCSKHPRVWTGRKPVKDWRCSSAKVLESGGGHQAAHDHVAVKGRPKGGSGAHDPRKAKSSRPAGERFKRLPDGTSSCPCPGTLRGARME